MAKRSRWSPALTLVALGAMVSLLVGSAAASSATNVKSTVTITSGEGTQFRGKVSASKKKCRVGRTVKLYREAGDGARTAGTLVETATTDARGVWTMDGSFLAGVYYARVVAVLVHVNGALYRCAYDWTIPMHY